MSVCLSVTLCIVALRVGVGVESCSVLFLKRHFLFTRHQQQTTAVPANGLHSAAIPYVTQYDRLSQQQLSFLFNVPMRLLLVTASKRFGHFVAIYQLQVFIKRKRICPSISAAYGCPVLYKLSIHQAARPIEDNLHKYCKLLSPNCYISTPLQRSQEFCLGGTLETKIRGQRPRAGAEGYWKGAANPVPTT